MATDQKEYNEQALPYAKATCPGENRTRIEELEKRLQDAVGRIEDLEEDLSLQRYHYPASYDD